MSGDVAVRRSPIMAAFLSGIFPGLGQLYNRQFRKAALFGVGAILTGVWPLSPLDMDIDPGDLAAGLRRVLLASIPFIVIALWSVTDAYQAAQSLPGPPVGG
jgi:hypothetical protein